MKTQDKSFEFLIGADGGGSEIRQAIVDASGGSFTGEMLDHHYKELEIPAGKNGAFQIEKEALHIWPRGGFMLIALPNLDGSFTVTLFMPEKGKVSFENLTDKASVEDFFARQFPTAVQLIPELSLDFFLESNRGTRDHPVRHLGSSEFNGHRGRSACDCSFPWARNELRI